MLNDTTLWTGLIGSGHTYQHGKNKEPKTRIEKTIIAEKCRKTKQKKQIKRAGSWQARIWIYDLQENGTEMKIIDTHPTEYTCTITPGFTDYQYINAVIRSGYLPAAFRNRNYTIIKDHVYSIVSIALEDYPICEIRPD
ncbi:hypothetical protein M0R04_09360 [Candidatus Dojkabacteria bacterium]|nr:hypothetical protein [Candidatus Dojkabacteria bacterium]